MARDGQRARLAGQVDFDDLVERVDADESPPLSEGGGQPSTGGFPGDEFTQHPAPTEPTPAQTVRAFYEQMVKRPEVSALLSRLAKK